MQNFESHGHTIISTTGIFEFDKNIIIIFLFFCLDDISLQTEVKSSKNTFRIALMLIHFGHSIIGFRPQCFKYYKLRFHWDSKSLICNAILSRESLKLWKFFQ